MPENCGQWSRYSTRAPVDTIVVHCGAVLQVVQRMRWPEKTEFGTGEISAGKTAGILSS